MEKDRSMRSIPFTGGEKEVLAPIPKPIGNTFNGMTMRALGTFLTLECEPSGLRKTIATISRTP